MRQTSHSLLLCPFMLAASAPGLAVAEESFSNLFTQGKAYIDMRYRYEHVDQDNSLKNANANTLRTRVGYQTGRLYGFSALIEVDNVARLGAADYNNTRNHRTEYSAVADPNDTEINQLLLRYDHKYGSAVFGRQRITLDNQRFVGGVAWRQNEQTYDGFLGQLKPIDKLTLTYAYIDNINTPFGPDGQHGYPTNPANIKGNSHLFNVSYAWRPELNVTAYHYLLGLDNLAVAPSAALGTQSSRTTGVRLTGSRAGFGYALEYAHQSDYGRNPLNLSSNYFLGELSYQRAGYLAKAGYEVLGGEHGGTGNRAFQTPLATKHIYQGWADMFLITPAAGLRDAYVGGSLPVPVVGGTLQAWYHDFHADRGGDHYGSEVDVAYARPVPYVKNLVALAKYAHFNADDFGVDTDKFWVQLQYKY